MPLGDLRTGGVSLADPLIIITQFAYARHAFELANIGFTYISDDFVDATAENTKIFNKQYQKKNNALPSFYATKGFDITYDILVRLASGKELRTTLDEGVSVRVESKFDYRNSNTVPENKGLFIVRYNKDLTLTRLK